MKIPLVPACLFAALAVSAPTTHGAWPSFLQSRRDFEVITVTDMTPSGRLWPAPNPDHP
jgi:hypothetical protein